MFPRINPTTTAAWKALEQHAITMKQTQMKDLFQQDPERFKKLAFCFNDLVVDISKNIITEETVKLLIQLAKECGLRQAIDAMFEGDFINETENRSVLHMALRNFSGKPFYTAGAIK